MPTYSYECKTCGHVTEVFHGINAKRRVKCEECSGACRRLVGAGAGIIFKGSGFYETDYKSKGPKEDVSKPKAESGEKSASKTSEKSTSSDGPSKAPEKKAEKSTKKES